MIRKQSLSMLVLVGLTAALLPLTGFASEEAEACPVGSETCGYVTNTVVDAVCVAPSTFCNSVRAFVDSLEFGDCEPIVCDTVTRIWELDPWATATTTVDDAAHIAVTRICAVSATGPSEETGGVTLKGNGAISCINSNGDRPVQMSVTACIQMNAGPGQVGWTDVYCNSGEGLPGQSTVSVDVVGLCIPGPGEGHRWRVRATGEAWFTNVNQPADFVATVDSFGRRLDCQPG